MGPEKVGRVLEKCCSGEPITDEELKGAIPKLSEIVTVLVFAGDRYYLAASELRRRLNQLEDYKEARKRD